MARSKMATLRSIRANGDDAPKDGFGFLRLLLTKTHEPMGMAGNCQEWELV